MHQRKEILAGRVGGRGGGGGRTAAAAATITTIEALMVSLNSFCRMAVFQNATSSNPLVQEKLPPFSFHFILFLFPCLLLSYKILHVIPLRLTQ